MDPVDVLKTRNRYPFEEKKGNTNTNNKKDALVKVKFFKKNSNILPVVGQIKKRN